MAPPAGEGSTCCGTTIVVWCSGGVDNVLTAAVRVLVAVVGGVVVGGQVKKAGA